MTVRFVPACAPSRSMSRKRLRIEPHPFPMRAPVIWLACAFLAVTTSACSQHDDDRAALTASAARELSGQYTPQAPQAANAITAFAPDPGTPPAQDNAATLPPLAVRTPAHASGEGGANTDPLVTPVIHTVD
jgi:hypothetical protein